MKVDPGFQKYLEMHNRSPLTIYNYNLQLNRLPENDVDSFIFQERSQMLICAYRCYLRYLNSIEMITDSQLAKALKLYKYYKSAKAKKPKWAIPSSDWAQYIKKAPCRSAKIAIMLGFYAGLRRSEIVHLRKQDINFQDLKIIIQEHKQTETSEKWRPKYNVYREIPMSKKTAKIIRRWISEQLGDIEHDYLLFETKKYTRPSTHALQWWCKQIHKDLHPHVLRYSFATTMYYKSDKDIHLVQKLLGHKSPSTTAEYLNIEHKELMRMGRNVLEKI